MTAVPAACSEPLLLPGRAEGVALARRFVRHRLLAGRVAGPLVADATLLVSEIVTNAVVHAGGVVGLRVDVVPGRGALVQVCDRDPVRPAPRVHEIDAMTGRGLTLVRTLASAHGTVRRGHPAGAAGVGAAARASGRAVHRAAPGRGRPADPLAALLITGRTVCPAR